MSLVNIVIITTIIVFLISMVIIHKYLDNDKKHNLNNLIISSFWCTFIIMMILTMIFVLVLKHAKRCGVDGGDAVVIKSVRGGTVTTGSFFIGTGDINSTNMYYTFVAHNGGFKLKSLNTKITTIYETDKKKPALVTYHTQCKNPLIESITGETMPFIKRGRPVAYDLIVPIGSIISEFKL